MVSRTSGAGSQQANQVMRMIMETYHAPNRTIDEEADMINSGGLDPLLGFGEACRAEFRKWTAFGPRLR
jgi:hypothetical protein